MRGSYDFVLIYSFLKHIYSEHSLHRWDGRSPDWILMRNKSKVEWDVIANLPVLSNLDLLNLFS